MKSQVALPKISKWIVVIILTLWLSVPKKFFKVIYCLLLQNVYNIIYLFFSRNEVRINSLEMEKCYLLNCYISLLENIFSLNNCGEDSNHWS